MINSNIIWSSYVMANHPSTSTYMIKNRPFAIENVDRAHPGVILVAMRDYQRIELLDTGRAQVRHDDPLPGIRIGAVERAGVGARRPKAINPTPGFP